MLAPFSKKPFQVTLQGITTDDMDLSVCSAKLASSTTLRTVKVDLIRTVTLPHLQLFGISDGVELRVCSCHQSGFAPWANAWQIKKRGAPPEGGGEVQFLCPVVKQVKTLNFVEPGKIKRIRGIA